MNKFTSIFIQMLTFFSRIEFEKAVMETRKIRVIQKTCRGEQPFAPTLYNSRANIFNSGLLPQDLWFPVFELLP